MDFNWKGFNLSALWQGAAIVSYTLNGTYNHGSMTIRSIHDHSTREEMLLIIW